MFRSLYHNKKNFVKFIDKKLIKHSNYYVDNEKIDIFHSKSIDYSKLIFFTQKSIFFA